MLAYLLLAGRNGGPVDDALIHRFIQDGPRELPFADLSWPEAAYRHLPDAADYRQVQPVFSIDANGRTWRQRRYPDYRRLIEPILLDRSNPIHELLDYDRLVDRLATGDANAGRTRQLWGVLTAAVWMGGLEQRIIFTRNAD